MNRRERGFTFIEVLVVMGIIAVLVGVSMAAVNYFINVRAPRAKTDTLVKEVSELVDAWKLQFETLPPSDPKRLARATGGGQLPSMPNETNVSIETLYQAFYWPGARINVSLGDDELSNTDDDEFDKPTTQGTTVYEIQDAWYHPLIYFVHTDYATAYDNPPVYVNAEGIEVEARPYKYEDEQRGFAEPRGFQIFSMGEDGIPNTEDDIKSWK